jgi:hypothetical protein
MGHWITATRITATSGRVPKEERLHVNVDRLCAIQEMEQGGALLIFDDDTEHLATRGPRGVLVKEPASHFMALDPKSEFYIGQVEDRRSYKDRMKHLDQQIEASGQPAAPPATEAAAALGNRIAEDAGQGERQTVTRPTETVSATAAEAANAAARKSEAAADTRSRAKA